ncbi:MAG: alpha/beta hydrolase [Deltaproteobacteria bacterium]|nr:alpha/beta hydrolase [Deltaproteobacteria bacterium]
MKLVNSAIVNGLVTNLFEPENISRPVKGYILYVHGGPGSHSAYFEKALQELPAYQNMDYGWVCYDQRGCGRSAGASSALTHSINRQDLSDICDQVKSALDVETIAIFGHSYGAFLAYDLLKHRPNLLLRLIIAGRSVDRRLAQQRSLSMDLLILKEDQPQEYMQALEILKCHNGSPWEVSKEIRGLMNSTERRKAFYWGNLKTMAWYDDLKSRVNIAENDDIYRQVRTSYYADNSQVLPIDVSILKQKTLWINGVHDYLMGGEMTGNPELAHIKSYRNSGHYPHLEQPEDFVRDVHYFLRGNS